jgi:RNA polymerase sigma factor (TIGR02999 family)
VIDLLFRGAYAAHLQGKLLVKEYPNMTPSPPNVTQLLQKWSDGDKQAQEKLFQVVYNELHRQAARYLRNEQPGLSWQTTDLIHETYLRLIDQQHVDWQNRLHFFGISAQVMRRILVDHARSRQAAKRGGSAIRLPLEDAIVVLPGQDLDFVALDEALNRLAQMDPQQSQIVELRFFSGLSVEETAEVMNVSERTVKRDWNVAKAWLRRELRRGGTQRDI